MASQYRLVKSFASFRGLDLRSGDLTRAREFASSVTNCDFRSTAALSKRKGWQHCAIPSGVIGAAIYSDLDTTTGIITDKLVTINNTVSVLKQGSISLSYSGSGNVYVTIKATGSIIELNLFEDDVLVTTQDLGTGRESGPITIADLTTALNALTDFSATSTLATSTPAAFLDLTDRTDIASSVSLNYKYLEAVNAPSASPFALHVAQKNNERFEPPTTVSTNGVLYISNGYDPLHKYDGQNLYRAGMPEGEQPTASINGAGSVTNSGLEYKIVYYQKDKKGNIVEGIISDASTSLSASSNNIDLTLDNIQASSGFNTNCAIVNGTQSGVTTIMVDNGSAGAHTLKIGDTAYFLDGVSGDYVERNVTAVTASSITIDGAAVNVSDNATISNNLRIDIYRNQAAGTTFNLLVSLPNNSFAATQAYSDAAADAALGAEYIEPIKDRGLPPTGKYMTLFRGQLIIGGFNDDVDAVAYSDIDGFEYFPPGQNRFNVDTAKGDTVSGVKALNSVLFVFKDQTIHTLTGDLIQDNFQVDILTTGGVGCASNATIQEVNGQLYFLDKEGVYAVTQGADGVNEVSELISPEFDASNYNFKRATAVHWERGEKYLLYMPIDEINGGVRTAASTSRVYGFDTYRAGWVVWNNINALANFAVLDEKLFFCSRGYSSGEVNYLNQFKDTGTGVDFADHEEAISAEYKTHWETLGEPSMFKKFMRLKLFSLDASVAAFETQLFKITTVVEHDFSDVPVFSHVFDFGNGSTGGWGENGWGLFPWGDARLTQLKTKIAPMKAQSLRIIFSNSELNKNFLLSGHELEVSAPFAPAIKE